MIRTAGAALVVGLAALAAVGCTDQSPEPARADTLTRRERDSMIGASNVPGAGGVRGATRAADSAAARRSREQAVSDTP